MLETVAQILCIISSVLLLLSFVLLFIGKIYEYRLVKLYQHGKHWCNFCRLGFLANNGQIEYEYCPFCGRRLELHKSLVADAVERPNHIVDFDSMAYGKTVSFDEDKPDEI
ncbi:MAG: hypothetical protein IJF33_03745 [Clostridia bacterium]|nr:hypothetical protein [Clostridia bacterium]